MKPWLKRFVLYSPVKAGWRVWPLYKKTLLLVMLVFAFAGLAACSSNDASQTPGTDVHYAFYTGPLKEITYTQTILNDPGRANVFWGNEFMFSRYVYGYTGFQTFKNGDGMFLYSVWGATGAASGSIGTSCQTFEENGSGYSCRKMERPIAGHTYQFQVKERAPGTYGVQVKDITAGTSFDLGQVQVEAGSSLADNEIELFTENFDWNNPTTRCGDEAYSRIANQAPTTVYDGKLVTATYLYSTASSECPGASKVSISGSQAIQESGIGNSPGGRLINQASGLCADVMNGSSEAGAPLIQYPCSNGSNQAFVFASDGTLHTQNHCLDAGASPPDGAPVVLAGCNGSATQQWKLYPNGSIESTRGLTLGIENQSTSSGARLIVKKIDFSNYLDLTKWTFHTSPNP